VGGEDPFFVAPGDRIVIGPTQEGLRVYVAIGGGIDVPLVLGSRSSLTASGLGGFKGRKLAAGDVLPAGTAVPFEPRVLSGATDALVLRDEVRVVSGPQLELFSETVRQAFFGGSFRVSSRSDRRGLRLEGAAVAPIRGTSIRRASWWARSRCLPAESRSC
jgi:allophanate hydrolase subunit 2